MFKDYTLYQIIIKSLVILSAVLSPVVFAANKVCENTTNGIVFLDIDSRASNSNRMVIVTIGTEGNPTFPTTATFDSDNTNRAMTLIGQSYVDDSNADSLTEIWAIIDADLPADAGTYKIELNGQGATGAMCAFFYTDLQQNLPTSNVTSPNGGASNVNINYEVDAFTPGIPSPSDTTITTQITISDANSLVISLTANGVNGSYTTQLTEQFVAYTDGAQAVIAIGGEFISSTGSLTVTDTASRDTNRQSQVIAAFAPAPLVPVVAEEFRISHDNVGANCSPNSITVTATNNSGIIDTSYTGTITISPSAESGLWAINNGAGVLTPLADGRISYTFDSTDNGSVELSYSQDINQTVNFDISDGNISESVSYDADLEIINCNLRISALAGSLKNLPSCSNNSDTITFTVLDNNNVAAANFAGTIEISTSTNHGNWVSTTGNGTLVDINADDGIATYIFDASDNGSVDIVFTDSTIETVNINVTLNGQSEDPSYDPNLTVEPCAPVITATNCYQLEDFNRTIALPSATSTKSSRMLLAFINSESEIDINSVTMAGTGNFSFIYKERTTNGPGNTIEVWGMLEKDLPDDAGSYEVTFSGGSNFPSICLVAVSGVKQKFPEENTIWNLNAPINGSNATGTRVASTTLRTEIDDSLIISAVSSGEDATTYWSTLSNNLWAAGDANPTSAVFYGNSEVASTADVITVQETNSSSSPNRHSHIALALAPKGGDAAYYKPVELFKTYSGNINYRATGNTLRSANNATNACSFVNTATGSTATLSIPADSAIIAAYLYWAGSGDYADIDLTVSFGIDGAQTSITADDIFELENPQLTGTGHDYFLGYKDVTQLISTASATYRLSDLTVQNGAPWATYENCVGGWGLVTVYENILEDLHTINLFHGLQPFHYLSFTLAPGNFRMASPDFVPGGIPNGQISHISFEGDGNINSGGESFRLQNTPNALTYDTLSNSFNSGSAQFNDTVTYPIYDASLNFDSSAGPNFDGYAANNTNSYGVDIDTFYLDGAQPGDILHDFGLVNAEEITTRYSAGNDFVILASEVISIVNSPIADLELFLSQTGDFKVDTTGESVFEYLVTNNGQGSAAPGYANGEVWLTHTLPSGMTINSLIATDGWDCSAQTSTAFTCLFDIANDYSTGSTAGELAGTESLPIVQVSVNIADGASYPFLNNTVLHTARVSHNGGSCLATSTGLQPDPSNCIESPQFDNVNDLEGGNTDLNDLDSKTLKNNNIDQISTTVKGVQVDLSIVKNVQGVLEESEAAQYLITVNNLGPDTTSGTTIVTDTLPPGIVPINASSADWTCTVTGQTVNCSSNGTISMGQSSTIIVNSANLVSPAVAGVYISNTATVTASQYNFDEDTSNNSFTDTTVVLGAITPSQDRFLLSTNENATIASNGPYTNSDIFTYDPGNDTSSPFLTEASLSGSLLNNIDAVHVLPNGHVILSTDTSSSTIAGVTFNAEDLVLYDPILETAIIIFDGSMIFTGTADIDAVYIDHNDSYTVSDWDIYFSTADSVIISGDTYQDNDIILYDLSSATDSLHISGSGVLFGDSSGDIDSLYRAANSNDLFFISSDDASSTAAYSGTPQTYSYDDLVQFNNANNSASMVFQGDSTPGIFYPVNASRKISAGHVIEDAYMGHFSIDTINGDTCSATTITIRKHQGTTHDIESYYQGSIIISNNINSGIWAKDATAFGTITDLGGGYSIYTFSENDNGSAILYLTQTSSASNINVNVSNGIISEHATEDETFSINQAVNAINYLDQFSLNSLSNDDGTAEFSESWEEFNDGTSSATNGNIQVHSGSLHFTNPSNLTNLNISRTINFSSYTPDTVNYPLTLSFVWARTNGAPVDSFQVQARSSNADGWTALQTFSGYTGTITDSLVSINLTAAGITPTATTQVRFMINAGYVIETLSIDNVQIGTATTACNVGAIVDHYAISHSGNGISCLVEDITFTAHTDDHTPVQAGTGVTLTLGTSTNKGTWFQPSAAAGAFSPGATDSGIAQYSFAVGESSVTLPFNYTNISSSQNNETLLFTAVDNFALDEELTESPILEVKRAGLRFYNETTASTTMPNLIAGRPSNHSSANNNLVIQAVRASDDNPAVCEAIFSEDAVISIELAFECINPDTCTGNGYNVDAIAVDPVTSSSTTVSIAPTDDNFGSAANNSAYQSIPMRFQTQASGDIGARFAFNYFDAGVLQLHARYNIAFLEGDGADSDHYMLGSSANNSIVRPFALDVDFTDDRRTEADISITDSYASSANSSVFAIAGEPISATVKAVLWDQADDVNNDGIADFEADLSNNIVTPNFGNESVFNYEVTLSIISDDPNIVGLNDNPGVPNGITGTLTQLGDYSSFNNGISTGIDTISINEVGIFDIHALLVDEFGASVNYLNFQGIEGGVANVGRFTPAYYEINSTIITARPNFPGALSQDFTYMNEDFGLQIELQAKNLADETTVNYFSDFAKLNTPNQINFYAFDDQIPNLADIDYSSRLSITPATFPSDFSNLWSSGVVTLSGQLNFSRESNSGSPGGEPEAPLNNLQLALTINDSDSIVDGNRDVNIDDGTNENSNFTYRALDLHNFYYGRLRLENSYGSEIPELDNSLDPIGEDLDLHVTTEYFDGSQFITNTDDTGSTYNNSALDFVSGSYTDNLSIGEAIIKTGINGTLYLGATNQLNNTDTPLYFQAPGEDNDGSVVVELDLDSLGLDFLKYDWRDEDANEIEDITPNNKYINNPRAFIEFGEYRGNDRIVFWQELFIE